MKDIHLQKNMNIFTITKCWLIMECNIDARGRAHRFKLGVFALSVALVLSLVIIIGAFSSPYWWAVAAMIASGGGFAIFEARAGWCVIRAMGFKTRI